MSEPSASGGTLDRPCPAYPPIADYAIIGDCRSAALVSRHGSIDWLCLPRFDSASVFAALLDRRRGGSFRIAPTGITHIERRYVDQTNVLETTFTTRTGRARLTDAMPVADEATKSRELWPEHEILRKIDVLEGEVEVAIRYEPRLDFARHRTRVVQRSPTTFQSEHGPVVLILRSEIPLRVCDDGFAAEGRAVLRAGTRAFVALSYTHGMPAVLPAIGDRAEGILRASIAWWRAWAAGCTYDWDYREAVVRSALTLKLLTYAPSGAVIAAPTTSLPEDPGGVRNWDYRYCWLRDAALTLRALIDIGYTIEAEAFLSWTMHATRLTHPRLQVLYDVYGGSDVPERTLDHLEGYAGSRPVRVGNAAADQLQLDIYGEVVDAAYQFVLRGGRLDRLTARAIVALGRTVCELWTLPDQGMWEPRSGRQHHTHSKVLCWVALDRLTRLQETGHVQASELTCAGVRDAIRDAVERDGWCARLNSYVAAFGASHPDASLLRLGLCGYTDPNAPRMRATAARIVERLHAGDGLLYRYHADDGLPGGEGAFGICSFWGAELYALQGRQDEARRWFETLLRYANDVGLFAEEIDPRTGALLGNFPQAFTHVGLINTALTLAERAGYPQRRPVGPPEEHKV